MLLKTIDVPKEYLKKTTIASNNFYSKIDIYDNKVIANGNIEMTWYYKDFTGIEIVKANMNSQFGQIVFLTGINSKNRVAGIDLFATQNINAVKDTNRILFCSGMFSFGKTNEYTEQIGKEIKEIFNDYKDHLEELQENQVNGISSADEIKKFKELLDSGIISQEEFETKKKQLLGL